MEKIDLSKNLKRVQEAYSKVVGGDPDATFVVYSVDKSATLDLEATGAGDLEEFISHFEDGQVQYGLSRLTVPGSDVTKILLLGWCPDSAPAKLRMSFAQNTAEVSKVLNGYHVQIVARDQDDLDADEFLRRVGAAAGANYSAQSNVKTPKTFGGGATSAPIRPKPIAPTKPSYVPKSTGKPVAVGSSVSSVPTTLASASSVKTSSPSDTSKADEWGGEKEIEVRDFSKKPLEDVPSAYKPLKVDIAELRKGKSDTISSTPVPFKPKEEEQEKDGEPPKTFAERMSSFNNKESNSSSSEGRLTSLPKPKPSHTVGLRFPISSESGPKFGSKPSIANPAENRNDKIVGGFKIFGAENGKTPAQLWAEKKGKFKSVSPDNEAPVSEHDNVETHVAKLSVEEDDDDTVVKPSDHVFDKFDKEEKVTKPVQSLPVRNLPPPPVRTITPKEEEKPEYKEDEEEEDEEEAPAPSLPSRSLPPPPVRRVVAPVPIPAAEEDEEEDEPAPALPSRSEPEPEEDDDEEDEAAPALPSRSEPEPEEEEEDAPALPTRQADAELSGGLQAIAEYDCDADEDNEISFKEGDLIVNIEKVDDEWWRGKLERTGAVGLFPSSYVTLKSVTAETAPAAAKVAPTGISAVAEYDCEADEENELSFKEGDLIVEIEKVDADWWKGKHSVTGAVGLFPASYVVVKD